jgi:hypothetical protein
VKELIKRIKGKMQDREYWLGATSGDNKILYFNTPIGEKPNFTCEVYIKSENDVEFKFKYLTKRCVVLSTDCIGSFFSDEQFQRFECDFWNLATTLYNFEHEDKGE